MSLSLHGHDEQFNLIRETVKQVDPDSNPEYVMGPGDEVPRLASETERRALGIVSRELLDQGPPMHSVRIGKPEDYELGEPEYRRVGQEIPSGAVVDETRKLKAYIAGPMSGYPEFNFPAFYNAAEWLVDEGYDVINPADRGWGEGDATTGELSDAERRFFYRGAVKEVASADLIVLLPGWEGSQGANLELRVARGCGLQVREWAVDELGPYLRFLEPEVQAAPQGRHPNSERFHALLEQAGELHDRKQADYGAGDDPFANVRASEEWGITGWVGAMVRLNDKVRRLQSLSRKGYLANEAALDSFMDIAVYALIAHVLYEDHQTEGKS